jgi:hypothetical protein
MDLLPILASMVFVLHLANSRIFQQVRPGAWRIDPRWTTARALVSSLPADVAVSAQVDLVSRVSARPERNCLPVGIQRAEFLLFDLAGNTWPLSSADNRKLADSLRAAGGWEVNAERDDFLLLERNQTGRNR